MEILLAGESWTSTATHIKGWDQFHSVTAHRGADAFLAAVGSDDLRFRYMPCDEAAERFPDTAEELARYDVVVLSDIGANTLLLPPEVWLYSRPAPNRLKAIREYVAKGGALLMVGGYLSFQGINGAARYRGTPVEEVLPVLIHPFDDRIEIPEGVAPDYAPDGHAVLASVGAGAPSILGLNEVVAKPGAETIMRLPAAEGGHPLLTLGTYGDGRSAAWTTDIGPHWLPQDFLDWPGFAPLMRNLFGWLARR
jgi:uncharacterized membrane protein